MRNDMKLLSSAEPGVLAAWMLSAEDFLAKMYRTPEGASVLTAHEAVNGGRCDGLFASFDPATSSWRTSQGCLTGGFSEFSGRWPRTGLMQNGVCFQFVPLVRHTHGKECSLWPTPRASDRDNCGGSNARRSAKRNGTYIGRKANPQVSEWLMGFPKDWSALPPSETVSRLKSRSGSVAKSSKRKKG